MKYRMLYFHLYPQKRKLDNPTTRQPDNPSSDREIKEYLWFELRRLSFFEPITVLLLLIRFQRCGLQPKPQDIFSFNKANTESRNTGGHSGNNDEQQYKQIFEECTQLQNLKARVALHTLGWSFESNGGLTERGRGFTERGSGLAERGRGLTEREQG